MDWNPEINVVQGSLRPNVRVAISDEDGNGVSLTGNPDFIMAPWKGGAVVASGSAVILAQVGSATLVQYAWKPGDTQIPGRFYALIKDGDESFPSSGAFQVEVHEAPGDAG